MDDINYIECIAEKLDDTNDVMFGLKNKNQKRLNSKYFYDKNGSVLFEKITKLDEYYPTKKELEILDNKSEEISKLLPESSVVIEFGSGSNLKITKLLKIIKNPKEYVSIDISKDYLLENANQLANKFPEIKVTAICADLNKNMNIGILNDKNLPKIGFFPGSTIGNFSPNNAKNLLEKFKNVLGKNNFLIIGVDLKKDIRILEKAYNDSEGVTAKFNKNILNCINYIFGSKFKESNFEHRAFFNTQKDRIEMHLVSKKSHCVDILDDKVCLVEGESIHTENSYKYSIKDFKQLCLNVGFEIKKTFTDNESFFGIFLLKIKS